MRMRTLYVPNIAGVVFSWEDLTGGLAASTTGKYFLPAEYPTEELPPHGVTVSALTGHATGKAQWVIPAGALAFGGILTAALIYVNGVTWKMPVTSVKVGAATLKRGGTTVQLMTQQSFSNTAGRYAASFADQVDVTGLKAEAGNYTLTVPVDVESGGDDAGIHLQGPWLTLGYNWLRGYPT